MFLVRKLNGPDHGKLYAMKVLKKASIVQKTKTTEHTKTERQVLQAIRDAPFLITLHYAFQTDAKLHLILGVCVCFAPLIFTSNCNEKVICRCVGNIFILMDIYGSWLFGVCNG